MSSRCRVISGSGLDHLAIRICACKGANRAFGRGRGPSPAQTVAFTPSASDQALIAQVETYLNDQKGLTANFLQVAADGSTRTGKAWLERPGKMRFEYDPPDKQLLVAGYGLLVYHDPQLNQTTNIPLGSTPLGILLAKHVDLTSGDVVVTNIQRQPGEDDITADPARQSGGGEPDPWCSAPTRWSCGNGW